MTAEPIRVAEFTNAFHLGGAEVQVVELLRGLPRQYAVSLVAVKAEGPLLPAVSRLGHRPETFGLRGSLVVFIEHFSAWVTRQAVRGDLNFAPAGPWHSQ